LHRASTAIAHVNHAAHHQDRADLHR
jgi:hypothetical protein